MWNCRAISLNFFTCTKLRWILSPCTSAFPKSFLMRCNFCPTMTARRLVRKSMLDIIAQLTPAKKVIHRLLSAIWEMLYSSSSRHWPVSRYLIILRQISFNIPDFHVEAESTIVQDERQGSTHRLILVTSCHLRS
jgi:hypothetical protein